MLSNILMRLLLNTLTVVMLIFGMSLPVLAEAGVVAFALGDASVRRGDSIEVGDRIKTGDNGHVHIRFIDGALVSIRPNSELVVNEYSYFPDEPSKNRVRLTLESGTVRSVTGEAGRTNKDAYRMNTPISAIGIRGTDYTVFSDDRKTRVFVQSGGIAIAPLDEECRVEDVGVCRSPRLVELFAGESHVIELTSLKWEQGNSGAQGVIREPTIVLSDEFAVNTLTIDSSLELSDKIEFGEDSIGWSHWSNFQKVLGNLFKPTSPFLESNWQIASANSLFGLFISPTGADTPRAGIASYELDRYEAYLITGPRIEQASMSRSSLTIRFGERNFGMSTTLSAGAVSERIAISGDMTDAGFFNALGPGFKVSGSIQDGGNGAGLLIERAVSENSRFVGASAWSKQ